MHEANPTLRSQFGSTTDPGDDAELVRLGAEFQEKHHRYIELTEKNQLLAGEPPPEVGEEIRSLMQSKQDWPRQSPTSELRPFLGYG